MTASTARLKKYYKAGSVIYQQTYNANWVIRCVRKINNKAKILWWPSCIERTGANNEHGQIKYLPPQPTLTKARAAAEDYARLHLPGESPSCSNC